MKELLKQYLDEITLRLDKISEALDDCEDEILYAKLNASWEELVQVGNRLNKILDKD